MKKQWSFYHRISGQLADFRYSGSSLERNTPPDHVAIEGALDHLSQRVDVTTGSVVDYQPPQPSPDHEWNATAKRWRKKAEAVRRQSLRDNARATIDAIESKQGRAMREALLELLPVGSEARKSLQQIEDEIAPHRVLVR